MFRFKRVVSLLAVTGMMFYSCSSSAEEVEKTSSVIFSDSSSAEEAEKTISNTIKNVYKINPGDVLEINVWKEEGMIQEVLVRPDGGISFPLVGDLTVEKLSLIEVEQAIIERLSQYLADPVVTVSAKQLLGNKIYVIGQINKPGEYIVNRNVDVMQVLSMAGGMTSFAAVNDIIILRRDTDGKQRAIEFEYGELEDGDELQQNIMLQAGDVVVVP